MSPLREEALRASIRHRGSSRSSKTAPTPCVCIDSVCAAMHGAAIEAKAGLLLFNSGQIIPLLALQADAAADSGEVRERAAAKIGEIAEKIARLERIRGALGALLEACPGSGPLGECSIMTAMLGDGLPSSGKE